MRTLEEIKRFVTVNEVTEDGGSGIVAIGNWTGSVIWSWGMGWEHVSVSPYKHYYTPTWSDMCRLKDIFFNDDEVAVQYHPRKNEYVNNKSNCLHLFRPTIYTLPEPPSFMVGLKPGQTISDLKREIDKYSKFIESIQGGEHNGK